MRSSCFQRAGKLPCNALLILGESSNAILFAMLVLTAFSSNAVLLEYGVGPEPLAKTTAAGWVSEQP